MDRITRLFGVQPASQRSIGRWAVPGLMVVLLATAILAASCEPKLVQDPTSQPDAGQVEKAVPTDGTAIVELHGDHAIAQLEKAMQELEMARQDNAITEAQYQDVLKRFKEEHENALHSQGSVAVPMDKGGSFILHTNDNEFIEQRAMSKEALQEFLSSEGNIESLDGATLHWVAEDGSQVNLQFGEDQLHTKARFFAEEAAKGAKVKPADKETP